MKLKNSIILAIVEAGGRAITANNIDDEKEAWQAIKFRQALSKAFNSLKASEDDLVKTCNLKADANGKIAGTAADRKKFNKLEEELLEDESDLGEIKPIPYAAWHKLKKENKQLSRPDIEDALKGLFWIEPEE